MRKRSVIRVLICDDHPIVREGLAALIKRRPNMQLVGEASNGREAVQQFFVHHPDVTLLDQRMPDMDGITALEKIREQCPEARIILLTTYDGSEDIYRGLRAGAKAYLLKDVSRDELMECIRLVHEGKTQISAQVGTQLASRVAREDLTSREVEVLQQMATGKSNKGIATILNISESTVKVHVNHILQKLGVESRTEAATVALKRGIVGPG